MSVTLEGKADSTEGIPKTAILVGAGNRGHIYASYATHFPDRFKVVGVCEPREYQRQQEQKLHNIPNEHVFSDWREAADLERFADSVLICTRAQQHKEPAIAFARKGYHMLLEKPIAVTEEDCKEIVKTCQENNIILCVCHVLRYTPWVQKAKEIIDNGELGDIVNINHSDPMGYLPFTHYNVRGDNRKESGNTSMLVSGCCHDIDLIRYWLSGRRCQRISSFGNLSHFKLEDKPKGAAKRCMDCPGDVETNCPYSAKKIYLESVREGTDVKWLTSMVADVVDIEHIEEALKVGPYGRCVYDMDNDVMSHQIVNMQFEGGVTATLQMVAFTNKLSIREVTFYGTKGEMKVKDGTPPKIKVYNFLTKKTEKYLVESEESKAIPESLNGYTGANYYTIKAFVDALHSPEVPVETGPDDALSSHLLVFAAERAKKENRVLTLKDDGQYD